MDSFLNDFISVSCGNGGFYPEHNIKFDGSSGFNSAGGDITPSGRGYSTITDNTESQLSYIVTGSENVYFEFTVDNHTENGYLRIGDNYFTNQQIFDISGGTSSATGEPDWAPGQTINVAINSSGQYFVGIDFDWFFGGNPETNINPTGAISPGDRIAIGAVDTVPGASNFAVTFNGGVRPFVFPVPNGYSAIDPFTDFEGTDICNIMLPEFSSVATGLETIFADELRPLSELNSIRNLSWDYINNNQMRFAIKDDRQYPDFFDLLDDYGLLAPLSQNSVTGTPVQQSDSLRLKALTVPFDDLIAGCVPGNTPFNSFAARSMEVLRYQQNSFVFLSLLSLYTYDHIKSGAADVVLPINVIRKIAFHDYFIGDKFEHAKNQVKDLDAAQFSMTLEKLMVAQTDYDLDDLPRSHTTIKNRKIDVNNIRLIRVHPRLFDDEAEVMYTAPPVSFVNIQRKGDFRRITRVGPTFGAITSGRVNGNYMF